MTYYIHYMKTAASHRECVDVASEYSDGQMTYYTHHRKMAAPHYVGVDVSSDDSAA
jgi:hypothetical protein